MNFKFKNTKQPEKVVFTEKGHIYEKGDEPYISVTTLLKNYTKPFDSDYWSTYKAVKDVLEEKGEWRKFKWDAGGWETVVDEYRSRKHPHYTKDIEARKVWYLEKWDAERVYAADLGNKAHADLEGDMLNAKRIKLDNGRIAGVTASDILDMQGFDNGENHLFTELLLWNDQFKIAGQADIVERQDKKVHIKDYKTSKVIEMEPFMDAHFLFPLEELVDTNYNKFTIQLSTYGWMLEQQGYEVTGLTMIHLDRMTGDHIQDYPLAYRPDLVRKMLNHYASL